MPELGVSNGGPPPPPLEKEDQSQQQLQQQPETHGFLYKWTNYLKGYQKRWFVLDNGLLHYYRNQAEMVRTCRGSISLHGAHIITEDSCNFVVSNAGGTQTYHLRAASEVERQKWVTALELAKTRAIQRMSSEDEETGSQGHESDDMPLEVNKLELLTAIKFLSSKLEDMKTCHGLMEKHKHALQHALVELDGGGGGGGANSNSSLASAKDLGSKMKTVNERATLLNITCNAMINASSEFLDYSLMNGKRWQRILESEREIRQQLEDMVQQLAKQHSHLEAMVRREYEHHEASPTAAAAAAAASHEPAHPPAFSSDEEDEFEDANETLPSVCFDVPVPPSHRRSPSEGGSVGGKSEGSSGRPAESHDTSSSEDEDCRETFNVVQRKSHSKAGEKGDANPVEAVSGLRRRRSRIPNKPTASISLWSIVKNCIGKDLSKIPVPVNFSEPLSMLQRLVEDFEYSEVLDAAARCDDDCEQMAHVAAFTVSAYSTTAIRSGKPFNPLLGETYECDRRDDKGFRCVSEQVSHHPPMVAQHCESTSGSWRCWQEFTMRTRFKGKYLEVEPMGIAHLVFPANGNHYTWRKVKTVIHNIVLGKLWIDQHGEMEVINHRTGDKCHMKFEPYSYFGGVAKKVIGTVNRGDKVEWVLNGTWDSRFEAARVIGEAKVKGKSSLEVEDSRLLWKVHPTYPDSDKFYNFSRFACELNEPEDDVALSDSRLRPDQRLMEEGEWERANDEKVRLEEKQRAVRRAKENEAEVAAQEGLTFNGHHQPIWFRKIEDEQNGGKLIHMFDGKYWECKEKQDWSACPDIF